MSEREDLWKLSLGFIVFKGPVNVISNNSCPIHNGTLKTLDLSKMNEIMGKTLRVKHIFKPENDDIFLIVDQKQV